MTIEAYIDSWRASSANSGPVKNRFAASNWTLHLEAPAKDNGQILSILNFSDYNAQ